MVGSIAPCELHPRDVALVVVVRAGRRPRGNEREPLSVWLSAERRGFAQEGCRLDRARTGYRRCMEPWRNHRARPVAPRRMSVKKPLARVRSDSGRACSHASSCASSRLRVVVRASRLGRCAGNERLMMIQARPRPFVDQKSLEPRPPERRLIAREIHEHRAVAGPHLAQEQGVHDLRSLDELGDHPTLGRRDSADRSTVMSVGIERAAIACSRAASGTAACSARGMATATAPANSAKTIVGSSSCDPLTKSRRPRMVASVHAPRDIWSAFGSAPRRRMAVSHMRSGEVC